MATLKDNRQVLTLKREHLDMMRAALEQYAYDNQKTLDDEDMRILDDLMRESKPLQTWAVQCVTTGKVARGRFETHEKASDLADKMTAMHAEGNGLTFQAYYLGVL